jgi:hypothetical protein
MSDLPPDPGHNYVEAFSEVQPETLDWFWLNRLAFGTLAMLDGDPGEGKSLVALDLCARLSTGRPMPDGSPTPGVCNSIVLQSEDRYATATLPRLRALGADLNHVFHWKPSLDADEPFRIPSGLDQLAAELERTHARLVVIDPLVDFLDPHVSVNSDQSIRRAFAPLRRLAESCNCLILMIRHLVKRLLARALYRGGGSIGISGVCRSCWLIGRDPDNLQRRIFAELKNNYAAAQPSLAFELRTDGRQPAVPHWLGETPLAADQLTLRVARPSPECDRAVTFLHTFLQDGPRLSTEVWAAAEKESLSRKTLHHAREKMRARFQRARRNGVQCNYWLLKGQQVPAEPEPAADDLADFRAALAEQIRNFPRSCPLDEDPE